MLQSRWFRKSGPECPVIDALNEILAGTEVASPLLIWGVILLAAVLRAFTGFGFALAAVPVFSLFMSPSEAVVLSASLGCAISLLTIRTYWGGYPLRPMAPLLLASLVGTGVGAAVLKSISGQQFQLFVGIAVILACLALTFYRPDRSHPGGWAAAVAGGTSGLLNGAFAIAGPPVIIYAMATEPEPARSRSFLLTFFLFSYPFALTMYAFAGFVTLASAWHFLLAFPAMYAGDRMGYRLFNRFGTAFHHRVALAVLYAVGAGIVVKALA